MDAGSLWSKIRTTIHICSHFPFYSQKPYTFFKLYTYIHINTYIHTYIHPTIFVCRVRHRPHSQGHKTCEKALAVGPLVLWVPYPVSLCPLLWVRPYTLRREALESVQHECSRSYVAKIVCCNSQDSSANVEISAAIEIFSRSR